MYKAYVKCCTSVGFSSCPIEHPPEKVGIVMTFAVTKETQPRYACLGLAFTRLPRADVPRFGEPMGERQEL